ncbi:MAG TPA: Mur ligase family protein [Acidimicrobiales bacterium]|nr:Mur ligase family protein [Acidimicrobiales bacterium]
MNSGAVEVATLVVGLAAAAVASLRWLRVAQREHYLASSTSRFAARWWLAGAGRHARSDRIFLLNSTLAALAVAGLAAGAVVTPVAVVAAAIAAAAPVGLSLRGRTSPLVWTPRLRTLAATTAVIAGAVIGASATGGLRPAAVVACAVALGLPVVIDAALVATTPLERRRLAPFLRQASVRLASVHPTVVAITGSYGKTSTKGYVAHLLAGTHSVVPTPRSFNNRAGLATAVNEHLAPGTDIFVAEMGTYGPGEISELCAMVPPDIAVITAVGPVHLERMGTVERIAEAKAEILERAPVAVLNVDNPLLAALADRAQVEGKKVWRCGTTSERLDVRVDLAASGLVVTLGAGDQETFVASEGTGPKPLAGGGTAAVAISAAPTNVACAVAVALELGVPVPTVVARLRDLPVAEHRQAVIRGGNGQIVIDDTYNANPAGAAAALRLLARQGEPGGRRVVVTPGMVELGARQYEENAAFARAGGEIASHLVVVGATNAAALLAGAAGSSISVVRTRHRGEAVAWVTANTGPGDAVLYENDLPDHFP